MTERDVALVPGAADRVVALVARAQLVRLDIGQPAVQLRGEQLACEVGIEREARRGDP
jgi:hypothetical protein